MTYFIPQKMLTILLQKKKIRCLTIFFFHHNSRKRHYKQMFAGCVDQQCYVFSFVYVSKVSFAGSPRMDAINDILTFMICL